VSRLLRDVPPSAVTPKHKGLVGVPLSVAKKTLQTLGAYDIVTLHGFIIAQHFKKDTLPERAGDLILFRQSRYANTALSFYQKRAGDNLTGSANSRVSSVPTRHIPRQF
jgi:hypothetical protein